MWDVSDVFTQEVIPKYFSFPIKLNQYTIRVVSAAFNNFATSLSVKSFAGLNGTNILCYNESYEAEKITAIVLGKCYSYRINDHNWLMLI